MIQVSVSAATASRVSKVSVKELDEVDEAASVVDDDLILS